MASLALRIDGMYCDHCAQTVAHAIGALPGVRSVTLDGDVARIEHAGASLDAISAAVVDAGYYTDRAHVVAPATAPLAARLRALGWFALAVAAVALAGTGVNAAFGYNVFNAIPTIDATIPLGMLVVTGVMTSLHCVSMCGAVNLAATAGVQARSLRTPVLYNAGRLVSYTALGGVAGALGGVVSMSQTGAAILLLLATAVMVTMSLRMAGVITVSLPDLSGLPGARAIRRVGGAARHGRGAFAVGLANGAMPCGPLQAMQLYALSTGSAASGAASMFLFCLGTVPLMLAMGYAANLLKGRGRAVVARVAAAFMFVLALSMLARGLSMAGVSPTLAAPADPAGYQVAELVDGVQTVEFDLAFDDYADVQVTRGVPVRMVIDVDEARLTGCNDEVLMPAWGVDQKLVPGRNVIEFTPQETGEYAYSCWMHMITNRVLVTD
ncbi:sulfite exporter TauE/SafE family protein [bacterium]|nr:sulfite exporter TauE/SafE family protein [bacterium]